MNRLAEDVKREVEAFTDPAVRELVAARLSSAVELEIDRAKGEDVTLGEKAIRASMSSIAYEQQVKFELAACRIALKGLVYAMRVLAK